ncbi:MAG: hypothetical protein ACLQLG_14635 [Thermoguttaceae bacterium]
MTAPEAKSRWYRPTPGWLLLVLLAVEVLLPLSERFHWFAFNEHKGWTVLIAVAVVGVAMMLLIDWFLLSAVFHWTFPVSVRSLLLLALAVAVPCGWLGLEMKEARKQGEIAAAIRKAGGRASYRFPPRAPAVQFWLNWFLGFDFFADVASVDAHGPNFDDAAVEPLKGLPQLDILDLSGTKVSDAGIENLKALTQLRYLFLSHTKVSDAGLKHLEGLSRLETLFLDDTRVGDAGLKDLERLARLSNLGLKHTKVTDEGVRKLRNALPKCMIFL